MKVEPREIASAPVSRAVAAEPVRTSVMGTGRPVANRPPAAVVSRPVVAVRTPPAPPRSIDQRQSQAGGHLNEQALVRPLGPSRPAPVNQNQRPEQNQRPQQNQEGFRSFGQPNNRGNENNNALVKPMLKPQPRVYEQQGTPQQESRGEPAARNEQPAPNRSMPENREFRPPQPQETHPLVRPAPQVQERTPQQEQQQAQKFNQWREQRPAAPAPPPRQQPSRAPEPKPSKH